MRSIAVKMWIMSALAIFAWVGVFYFSALISAQKASIIQDIQQGKSLTTRRASINASIALASATEEERLKLETAIDTDVLTISNLFTAAGQSAGIPITIISVTPGPGPALPKGSALSPSRYLYSVKASGTYAQVLTAVSLLQNLPADSTIESIQFTRGDASGSWNANVTVGVVTGVSLSS